MAQGLLDYLYEAAQKGASLLAPNSEDVKLRANMPGIMGSFVPMSSLLDVPSDMKQGNYGSAAINTGMGLLDAATLGVGTAAKVGIGALGMFAGKGAKTADLAKQGITALMLKKGDDPAKVWKETGWGIGPDGKWRFEINDSVAAIYQSHPASYLPDMGLAVREKGASLADYQKMKEIVDKSNAADGKIGSMLNHADLYSAYPELQKYRVKFDNSAGPFGASVQDDTVTLGKASLYWPDYARQNSLHELTHVVQDGEGFARGSDLNIDFAHLPISERQAMYDKVAGEAEARQVANRINMTAEQRADSYPWNADTFRNQTATYRPGGLLERLGVDLNDLIFLK